MRRVVLVMAQCNSADVANAVVSQLASTGGIRPDLDPDRARDIVWTLISPEVYELLVNDRGWSPHEYEQWLARALADALAAPQT